MTPLDDQALREIEGGGGKMLDVFLGVGCGIGIGAAVVYTGGLALALVISGGLHSCAGLVLSKIEV
jgi:hypothetical protein